MTYTRFPKPTLFPSQPTFPQVIHSQHTTSRRHLLVAPLSLFAVHLRLGSDGDGASGDRGASRECGLLSNPLQGDAQRDPVTHEIPARRGPETVLVARLIFGIEAKARREAVAGAQRGAPDAVRSEEHTSELQSLMRISYA